MSASLEIRDIPDGIFFRVTEPRRVGRVAFGLLFGAIAILFFIHFSQSIPLKIFVGGFCVFTVIRALISGLKGTDVELRVTNFDFKSTGHSPTGYKPTTISRADVHNMEYRKSSGGGEDQERPSGLYVERSTSVWQTGTCVLPDIDEAQTLQVIEAIYRRFPDTGTLAPIKDSAAGLISLNLNQRP